MESNEQSEAEYLKELAPSLFENKLTYNPEAPAGYFEEFGAKLNAKILAQEVKEKKPKTRVIHLINYRNLAIAASVAAILALVPFFNSTDTPELDRDEIRSNLIALDLDEEDISDYLDAELVYEAFTDEDLNDLSWTNSLDADDIQNYLLEENISEELIINTALLNEQL